MTQYVKGHVVKLEAEFTAAGVLSDPTTVVFTIKIPSGTITTYTYGVDSEVVRSSTGLYHVLWTTTEAGRHSWDATGTGTQTVIEDKSFYVRDSDAL